ncbi:cytochrome P450, partial [Panaeolus papilionaceus]
TTPGKWLVVGIPILMYWPEWLPGDGFKSKTNLWRKKMLNLYLEPHEWVKQQMAGGVAIPPFTSQLLESEPEPGLSLDEQDELVFQSASAIYTAGHNTVRMERRQFVFRVLNSRLWTHASVKAFYLLMILHLEVQKRVQAEVDALIAQEWRLPGLQDKESLPYVKTVMLEVWIWVSPAPFTVPRANSKGDEYLGYFIPRNSTLVPNIRAMAHDPEFYPRAIFTTGRQKT